MLTAFVRSTAFKTFTRSLALKAVAWTLLALVASGCWDYSDLENRAPILGLAFDRGEDPAEPVKVAAEIPIASAAAPTPTGQAGRESRAPKIVFESAGSTISEAVAMLNEVLVREPIQRHIASVVVSSDFAAEGIEPLLDYFLRNPMVNLRAVVWVTEGKARDVLETDPPFQSFVSFGLETALLKARDFPIIPQGVTIESFGRKIGEGGVIVPRVEAIDGILKISGAGVFSAQARFVGFLDEVETVGAAWILGTLRRTEATFPCPVDPSIEVGATLRASGRRLEFVESEGELSVRMQISGTVELTNLNGCPLRPWQSAESRTLLAEVAARTVEHDAEAAFRRAQELGVDFLRIGLHLSRRRPELWKSLDWPALFPKVPISVSARMTVDDPGNVHDGVIMRR